MICDAKSATRVNLIFADELLTRHFVTDTLSNRALLPNRAASLMSALRPVNSSDHLRPDSRSAFCELMLTGSSSVPTFFPSLTQRISHAPVRNQSVMPRLPLG